MNDLAAALMALALTGFATLAYYTDAQETRTREALDQCALKLDESQQFVDELIDENNKLRQAMRNACPCDEQEQKKSTLQGADE